MIDKALTVKISKAEDGEGLQAWVGRAKGEFRAALNAHVMDCEHRAREKGNVGGLVSEPLPVVDEPAPPPPDAG